VVVVLPDFAVELVGSDELDPLHDASRSEHTAAQVSKRPVAALGRSVNSQ
jgi:hypothetical protein